MNRVQLSNTLTPEEMYRELNRFRLKFKNEWFSFLGFVMYEPTQTPVMVEFKNYNTFMQVFRVNGSVMNSGTMEMKVSEWKMEVKRGINCK